MTVRKRSLESREVAYPDRFKVIISLIKLGV